jgi:hypothetical protein
VRTRIYFTSESHMHSLLNVVRYCHLGLTAGPGGLQSNLSAGSLGSLSSLPTQTSHVPEVSGVAAPRKQPPRARGSCLKTPPPPLTRLPHLAASRTVS